MAINECGDIGLIKRCEQAQVGQIACPGNDLASIIREVQTWSKEFFSMESSQEKIQIRAIGGRKATVPESHRECRVTQGFFIPIFAPFS